METLISRKATEHTKTTYKNAHYLPSFFNYLKHTRPVMYLCVNMGTFIQQPQTLHNTQLKPKDYTCYNNHNLFITIPISVIPFQSFHFNVSIDSMTSSISPSMPTASKRNKRHSHRRYLQLHKPF